MSALGQKRTLRLLSPMSALAPKADIGRAGRDVRFVPKADMSRCNKQVLFDHISSKGDELVRYRETEGLGGREINDSAGFAPRSILSTRSAARRHMLGQFGP